ncbi:unnamed protein product [Lampetra planeri]
MSWRAKVGGAAASAGSLLEGLSSTARPATCCRCTGVRTCARTASPLSVQTVQVDRGLIAWRKGTPEAKLGRVWGFKAPATPGRARPLAVAARAAVYVATELDGGGGCPPQPPRPPRSRPPSALAPPKHLPPSLPWASRMHLKDATRRIPLHPPTHPRRCIPPTTTTHHPPLSYADAAWQLLIKGGSTRALPGRPRRQKGGPPSPLAPAAVGRIIRRARRLQQSDPLNGTAVKKKMKRSTVWGVDAGKKMALACSRVRRALSLMLDTGCGLDAVALAGTGARD